MNTNTEEKGSNEIDFSKNHINNNFYLDNNHEITIDLSSKDPIATKNYFFKNNIEKNLSHSQLDVANILTDMNKVQNDVVNTTIKLAKTNENEGKNKSIISSIMIDLKEESSYDPQNDQSSKIDEKKVEGQVETKKKTHNSSSKLNCGSCDIF